ncbi:NYN domain-containing protein [Nocardioides xinjiangensis]|uniref:NYN domain-containing protein n=1 Tax=Nocardioides xinjiangensis TaxID=2817376 RepID=UPI001B310CEC|nr:MULTISPECIES: NYN domain-containing protein [unclassified Nocardioides]
MTRWVGARSDVQVRAATEAVDETALVGPTESAGSDDPAFGPTPRRRALPRRGAAVDAERATRRAVLIDTRRIPEDVAAKLLARLGERGPVDVCRAYADWSRSDLGAWAGRLRPQGLSSFHQLAADGEQALVAMAIDAVDIAREAAVDEVVIVGDMTCMLPLVHRLHSAGVRVVVVGPAHTAHDVRAACDEFIDFDSLTEERAVALGRHRA